MLTYTRPHTLYSRKQESEDLAKYGRLGEPVGLHLTNEPEDAGVTVQPHGPDVVLYLLEQFQLILLNTPAPKRKDIYFSTVKSFPVRQKEKSPPPICTSFHSFSLKS